MMSAILLFLIIGFVMINLILQVTVSDTRYFEHADDYVPVTNKALGGTTATPFVVPPHMNHIIGLVAQFSANGAGAGAAGGIASLSGDGLTGVRTPIEIPMGAFGATLVTTHSTPSRAGYIPTNIPCVSGSDIDALADMVGVDIGAGVSSLEIEFSSVARPEMPQMTTYKTLEVSVAAVDTWTELESAGAAKKFKPATQDKLLRQLITAVAGDAAGTGGASTALRFSGTGIKEDQIWTLDGHGGEHATEANGHSEVRVRDIMAEIEGNQPITAQAIMSGEDTGSILFIVGCGFSES